MLNYCLNVSGVMNIFKNKGKTLYFNHWIRSDIAYVKDLLDNNGNLSQEHIFKETRIKNPTGYLNKSQLNCVWKINTSMSNFIQRNLLERLFLMTKSKTYSLQEGICNAKLFYKTFVEEKYEKLLSESGKMGKLLRYIIKQFRLAEHICT